MMTASSSRVPVSGLNVVQTPTSLTLYSVLNRTVQRSHLLEQTTSRRRRVSGLRIPRGLLIHQPVNVAPVFIPTHLLRDLTNRSLNRRITRSRTRHGSRFAILLSLSNKTLRSIRHNAATQLASNPIRQIFSVLSVNLRRKFLSRPLIRLSQIA